jgi:hypothetical protein
MGGFDNLNDISPWRWMIMPGFILLPHCFRAIKHIDGQCRASGHLKRGADHSVTAQIIMPQSTWRKP